MPRKPKRPCSYPGCSNLTDGRFCPEHEKMEAKRYERYDRDPNTKRRYGRAWKRIRDSYAAAHPLCERCLENGVYTPTEQIHHVKPLSQGGTHDRENLMALCDYHFRYCNIIIRKGSHSITLTLICLWNYDFF